MESITPLAIFSLVTELAANLLLSIIPLISLFVVIIPLAIFSLVTELAANLLLSIILLMSLQKKRVLKAILILQG